MSKTLSLKKTFEKLCDDINTDIDAELCDEVKTHLKECPDCRVYVDTLRETVYLYRGEDTLEKEKGISKEVSDRLFKVLKLDDMREETRGGNS